MLIDYFLEIFSQTCVNIIPWIPGIIGLWVLFNLVTSMLFRD